MNRSIKPHREHGLNPTIPVCFWCRKGKNQIALLGSAYKGKAPKNLLMDYDPCDKCEADMAQGITFIEAEPRQPNEKRTPMQDSSYPTGRWWVVKEEAVRKMMEEPMLSQILNHRKCFIDPETAKRVFGEFPNEE